jgi:hypothetical protein
MTNAKYFESLKKQFKGYIDFLQYCENDKQRFKLLNEITFLKHKIQKMGRMTVSELYENWDCKTVTIESK